MARRLDELIAAISALHEDQQALLRELRLIHEEIRALRADLGVTAPGALPAPAPPAPTAAAPPSATPDLAPTPPRPRRVGLAWRPADLLARLPRPEAPRALLVRTWVIALLVGVTVAAASELNVLEPVEVLAGYPKEWVRGDRNRRDVVSQIVTVAIDTASIEKLGPWGPPWRAYHGQLLRHLADDGARAAGFDVSFKAPNGQYDPAFVDGIRHARSKGMGVVVGVEFDPQHQRFSRTVPAVREAASDTASVYLLKDRVTNLTRYVSMYQPDTGDNDAMTRLVPALSVAVALTGGRRAEEFPRYRDGLVPIDFAGPSSVFQTVPYVDVVEKRFPPGAFKDKYVLVGAFFAAARDFFDTPVESEMPGVLIHANALYTLLKGIGRPIGFPWSAVILLSLAFATGGVCARFRELPRAIVVSALVVGYWALAIGLGLTSNPLSLAVVPGTTSIALMWAGVAMREKFVAMRELRRSLGLPEDAVRRLEQDRAFQQGTLARRVTVLASDVKNYSAFSRSHPPTHVRQIMTEYQQMVERVIYRHGGYVNKFIGDAVIAIFGYPMDEERTALRCVLVAKESQEGLRALTTKWKREGKAGIEEIRIGINTGVVNISYLGSAKKQLDVLGASIDLAARLESAAGEFGCLALLGPETYDEVKGVIRSRSVPVSLKNRPDVTEAHTLDGLVEEPVGAGRASSR